jgi:hypothetical protein
MAEFSHRVNELNKPSFCLQFLLKKRLPARFLPQKHFSILLEYRQPPTANDTITKPA